MFIKKNSSSVFMTSLTITCQNEIAYWGTLVM